MFDALRSLAEEMKQELVTHDYLVAQRFGLSIRTRAEVDRFLAWMKAEGLAASTWSIDRSYRDLWLSFFCSNSVSNFDYLNNL